MRCKLLNPPLSNTNSNTEGVMTLALYITQVQSVSRAYWWQEPCDPPCLPSVLYTVHTKFRMIQHTSSRTTRRQRKDTNREQRKHVDKGAGTKAMQSCDRAVKTVCNHHRLSMFTGHIWLPYHILIRAKDAYCWTKFLQVGVAFSRNMPPETP